ncbi:MAG TPA: arabinose isomerase [Bryobacteraceae bacterium]|nr:arabinose isomerase [Bryobacteraceae bacterium]
MSSSLQVKVALCGIGIEAYWKQFSALRPELEGYLRTAAARLSRPGIALLELGMVDTPMGAREAGRQCRRADVDLLFVYVTTYALSSTVLPLVQKANVPVIVLNLQPQASIDYEAFNNLPDRRAMTGAWLAYCSSCPVPEIANVFGRAAIPFHQVIGVLGEDRTWAEIGDWLAAARVKSVLAETRLGLLGHYYSGMLDVSTDLTQICISFGTHVEMLEVDELSALRTSVSEDDIAGRVHDIRTQFEVQQDCSEGELQRAARTSIALDNFVQQHQLDALAYYYKGSGNADNEDTMSSIIVGTSMLTGRHIPVAGEYEVKNALAMKIMDTLGAGGSFTEYYALDSDADVVLMGHDGPGHIAIAEGKTKIRPLEVYHGKVGRGLSVEMSVRYGPVTLLAVVEDDHDKFKLLVAEGECVAGDILQIGNTNSRYHFPLDARSFVEDWNAQGPAHHCAVGLGHVADRIEKLSKLLGIGFHKVC